MINNEMTLEEVRESLASIHFTSTSLLVQVKTKKALADAKRAATLLAKASATLAWAKAFVPEE